MKYTLFATIGLIILVSVFMIGCEGSSDPIIPEEPPVEEVIQWLDVVPGEFFQLVSIHDEGTFSRSSGMFSIVEDLFVVFEDDGDISVWYDNEPNGILEPEDYVGSAGEWTLENGVLLIDGEEFFLGDVSADAWCMTIDISQEFEECLGEAGYEVSGTRTFCYEIAFPVYMTPDMLIYTEFPFAFSDRNETGLSYTLESSVHWWSHHYYLDGEEILLDEYDGFYILFGDVGIVFVTFDDSDRSIILTEDGILSLDVDGNPFVFQPNAVYDMTISVQPNDVALYTFVSRLDEDDIITVAGSLTYAQLGAIRIIALNDVSLSTL